MKMKFAVIVFPGSNCDHDALYALKKNLNVDAKFVWHRESDLSNYNAILIPGGFSYGDYLRTGCIASKSKIVNEVIKHGKNGGLILGICNGFQILIETGLLPGALLRNTKLKFLSKNVFLKVLNTNNIFCTNYKNKNIIELPIAHNEGNFFGDKDLLKKLEDNNLIAFKYCDKNGKIGINSNPNGSLNNIAGILNDKKNILGMMPHPERMVENYLSGEDGSLFFENLINNLK